MPARSCLVPSSTAATGHDFDDVVAFLQMDHGASDPPGVLRVGGFMGSRYETWPGSVFLGRVNVGERVFLNLAWDQPNHRFITRLFKPASHTFVEQYMPYSVPDSLPAAAPARRTLRRGHGP